MKAENFINHHVSVNFLKILLGLLIAVSLPYCNVYAQQNFDINSTDLSKIKVDDINDDQIRRMMDKAAENGFTQQQIEDAALAKGMPQAEVQKLRLRMNTVKTLGPNRNQQSAISAATRLEPQAKKRTDLKPEDLFSEILEFETDSVAPPDPRKKIFGYSLFNTKDLTFEPSINMPTPENYILGPGDEVLLDIWGASQQNYRLVISPDGYVLIDNVGPVMVNGLPLKEATKAINSRLFSIYSGMRGNNPNTHSQISLGNLRSIKVIVLGEAYLPGLYTLSSLSHAFNALYLSGGPDINGSLRNIEIIRHNKVIDTIDVYDFLFRGEIKKNRLLNDQDIIKINPYNIRVNIVGEVKRPLIYEMKPDEVISDLIQYAGGFSEKAYTNRIKIVRNTSREKQILDVSSEEYNNAMLQNGDSIIVEPILKRFANRVEIRGAVYRPGEYSIMDSLSLLSLIDKAEGLKGDAFLSRAVIIRTREDYALETIPVDLASLIKGTNPDIKLKREDIVMIPSIFDVQEEYYIQIDGEVKNPGRFPFMYNSTVEDIILQAGGFLESASMAQLEIARRVKDSEATTTTNKLADIFFYQISKDLKLSEAGRKLKLEPFDRIFIRRSPGYSEQITARIEGEVLFPGEYSISNKDERISDLINRSGGLTSDAYPRGASLIRTLPVDEKVRTDALRSGDILREDYISTLNQNGNFIRGEKTNSLNEYKIHVLDSILTRVTTNVITQAIGIDLERILAYPRSKYDLIIEKDDRLIIPKLLQTVRLSGELLHPITTRYDERYNFKQYIRSAGGFTTDASKSKSYVIYANGSVDVTRTTFGIKNYPKLEPGAEIVVPGRVKRPVKAGEIVSLGSALTSMALLVVTLLRTL